MLIPIVLAALSIVSFNKGWEFRREGETDWKRVTVPHDALCGLPFRSDADPGQGYVPTPKVTYRKIFWRPKDAANTRYSVKFDGVYMDSSVFLNGHKIGARPNGFVPFEVELGELNLTNVLEVVCNPRAPNARWYCGAGLVRNVYLLGRRGFSLSPEDVTVKPSLLDNGEAKVEVSVDGARVISPANGVLKVRNPRLWSPETPNLYDLEVVAEDAKGERDTVKVRYGIRTIRFTLEDGFHLNGRRYQIKGLCLHENYGVLGGALNLPALRRQLMLAKEMGANAIRTVHNPFAPEFYDLCDEIGLMVKDEMFDEWRIKKTMYGYHRFFDEWWKRDLQSVVRRDRNHPCVVLWSIGNEIPEDAKWTDGGATARAMVAAVKELDVTRPVTMGICFPDGAYTNGVMAALDVIGLNYNAAWFAKLKGWKPVFGSETAASMCLRGCYLFKDDGKRLIPIQRRGDLESAYALIPPFKSAGTQEETLKIQRDNPWSAGEFTWSLLDYVGEPVHAGIHGNCSWPARSSYWGACDLVGMPKDRFYLYQSQWSAKPMVHLLPEWSFPEKEGKLVPVWCYTNAKEAELFLNGKSQGVRKFSETTDLHLAWEVPYEPGEIVVKARHADGTVTTDRRATWGSPVSLRETKLFESDGVVFFRYDAVDAKGERCASSADVVDFHVTGGKILGADNGDPTCLESPTFLRHHLFSGSIVVIIRRTKGEELKVKPVLRTKL